MIDVFRDALLDTLKILPVLFLVYVLIEYIEYKFGHEIREKVQRSGKAGPAIGAAAGTVPQCGFSVLSTVLYNKRLITLGTLMAVYLATSDEAIPIILSHPDKLHLILPLILTKFIIAIIAGYLIDLSVKSKLSKTQPTDNCIEEKGCCGHECDSDKLDLKEIVYHPFIHTLKISLFILVVSILINLALFKIGSENLAKIALSHSFFQPILTGLIGLIPNCAASVAVTQLYLSGVIGYGSTISGLSAGAGLGIIVLFKETKNLKKSLRIIALLFSISIATGLIIQYFYN